MNKPVSLKVLDSIRIESPCRESWDKMGGDERRRFCERCSHSVNNISEMTREEAAAVMAGASEGKRVCVRFRRGADGAIQYKPSRAVPPSLLRRAAVVALGILTFMRTASVVHAQDIEQGDVGAPRQEQPHIMGEMVAVTPQPTPGPTIAPEATLPCHSLGMVAVPTKTPGHEPVPEIMGKVAPAQPQGKK